MAQQGYIFKQRSSWFLRYRDNFSVDGKIVRKQKWEKLAEYCDRYRCERDVQPLADPVQRLCNFRILQFTCKPLNLNGGDDETRTRDLCSDSGDRNRNLLTLNGTDGHPKTVSEPLSKAYWTVIGQTIEFCR